MKGGKNVSLYTDYKWEEVSIFVPHALTVFNIYIYKNSS